MVVSFPHLVAAFFWSLLATSVALTFAATLLRSWRIALLAAGSSVVFAIAGLFSIGALILLLTVLQLLLAFKLYRQGA